MISIQYVITTMMFGVIWAFNPGLVLKVHRQNIPSLMKVTIPILNPFLKNIILVDEINVSIIKLSNSTLNLQPFKSDQIECPPIGTVDFIECGITSTTFDMQSDAKISAGLFHTSGKIKTRGLINEIKIRFGFQDFDQKRKGKPFLKIELMDIKFDKNSLAIEIDVKNIPHALIDEIIKLFKSFVVDEIQKAFIKYTNNEGNDRINKMIESFYPESVALDGLGISFRTELNSKARITERDLIIGIDATFYQTETEYHRTTEAPIVQADDKLMERYFFDVSVTNYTLNTFFEAIYKKQINYSKGKLNIDFVSTWEKPNLAISEKGITCDSISWTVRTTLGERFIEMDENVSFNVNVKSRKNIDFFVDFVFTALNLNDFQLRSNIPFLNYFSKMAKYVMMLIFALGRKFSIDIPNINFPFDIKMTDFGLLLKEGYIETGISGN